MAMTACLAGLGAASAASAQQAPRHAFDTWSELTRQRIARLGASDASGLEGMQLLRQLQVDPASPYSADIDQPAFTNDLDWEAVASRLPSRVSQEDALQALRFDIGTTRARPGVDVVPRAGFRDDFVAAGATKAGVDPDIFWHALDLTGQRHSTRAAMLAVAVQHLRDQAAVIPADRHEAMGVDDAVLRRVMQAQHAGDVDSHDYRYLTTLVRQRLLHPRLVLDVHGRRPLPEHFRMARVAAAYRDAAGYVAPYPCTPDAQPRPGVAGMGNAGDDRPLCFVAASDRSVHAWFVRESHAQRQPPPEAGPSGAMRLFSTLALLMPLLDVAAVLEVAEAAVADDMLVEGSLLREDADLFSARVQRLICPLED